MTGIKESQAMKTFAKVNGKVLFLATREKIRLTIVNGITHQRERR